MQNTAHKTPQPAPQNPSSFCENRLSAAFFYTNELKDSRLREIENRRQTRWNAPARAKKSREIKQIRPWLRSTGPKTARGKGISALNAYKHGRRSLVHRRYAMIMRLHSMFCRQALLVQKARAARAAKDRLAYALAFQKLVLHKIRHLTLLQQHITLKAACFGKNYEIDVSLFSHDMLELFEKVMIHVQNPLPKHSVPYD